VIKLTNLFPQLFQDKALVSIQNSIKLNEYSQPEPDLVLLKKKDDFYLETRPTPEDIFLLIEVSDSTWKYDQEIKLPLYAENNIKETWIINLNNDSIATYRYPEKNFYQERKILTKKDNINCLAFPQINISIQQLLP
jgi:Uma2 family endonuclease